MAHYAIGDVQGCYDELCQLLDKIKFDATCDKLWFAGDIINRGHQSIKVLELLYSLRKRIILVLGNHDFLFFAVSYKAQKLQSSDTLEALLEHPMSAKWCDWLLHQPLFHYDESFNIAMAHAGVPWHWNEAEALAASNEVTRALLSDSTQTFMEQLYGDEPTTWQNNLSDWDRLRYIVNAFTRMRFVDAQGALDFTSGHINGQQKPGSMPWYEYPKQKISCPILFGHWASLEGITSSPNALCLDTGCAWGGHLTAYRIEDKTFFQVPSHKGGKHGF